MSNTVQNEADTKTTFSQNQKQALQTRNNNNDRLTAFDPGQPG